MANNVKKKVTKDVKKTVKKNLKGVTLVVSILCLVIGLVGGYFLYQVLNKSTETNVTLKGDTIVNLNLGDTYSEEGYEFIINGKDLSSSVTVDNPVDTNTKGIYVITYSLEQNGSTIELTRVVHVNGGVSDGE